MSYFYFQNKRVWYEEQGTGTPLFLLHGNAASSNMFYYAAKAYSEKHKVILIDFLGHGQSDRLDGFPADLWFFEAAQVLALIEEKQYQNVSLIGSSGGALAAINAGLERPELIQTVIADSFEGETPLPSFTQTVAEDRARSKEDEDARRFFQYMHGPDWESVVDNDTRAIAEHAETVGRFFHQPLEAFRPRLLLTGSLEDEFVAALSPNYFEAVYGAILQKVGHGSMHLFPTGAHPAMLSNAAEFIKISERFLEG